MKILIGALQVFYQTVLHELLVSLGWLLIGWCQSKTSQEVYFEVSTPIEETIPYRDNKAYLKLVSHIFVELNKEKEVNG